MRVAIYPGSFNPIHEGHLDVLSQVHKMFDKVIVAVGHNPEKLMDKFEINRRMELIRNKAPAYGNLSVSYYDGLLSDFVKDLEAEDSDNQIEAIIRGIRNTKDFEDEKTLKYLYQDSGLVVPVIHIISSRALTHVSSSAIRAMEKLKK